MPSPTFNGFSVYQIMSKVILEQVLRQAGSDSHIQAFRDLLMRVRNGSLTHDDWKALLDRTAMKANNSGDYKGAIRLFYDKQSVAKFNHEKLSSIGIPIATISAIHSSPSAASAQPDDAGGLHPVLFLVEGAKVIFTANLWQEVGLCNGAPGIVEKFIYQENHAPPDLPIACSVGSFPKLLWASIHTICHKLYTHCFDHI